MQELTVSCGCGRTMRLDTLKGRGAFRCGCGARIRIQDTPQPEGRRRCWWTDCKTIAITEAPIAFCKDHLMHAVKNLAGPDGYRALWKRSTEEYLEEHPVEQLPQPPEKPTYVYFMRREILIKIGISNDPLKRAQSLNAVVLAYQPGTHDDERNFHRRFKHLRVHNEWFRPGEDLIAYINKLRKQEGFKPVTASPDRHFLETILLDGSTRDRT